jgi:SH3 domain protein
VGGLLLLLSLTTAGTAKAAWVREEVRVKLREGAPANSLVIGVVKTGDEVTILERGEGWIRIRTGDGREGFIPNGFLQSDVPAAVRLERVEAKLAQITGKTEEGTKQQARLRAENTALKQRDADRESAIERLSAENLELQAGERWPYLITGAGILGFGMIIGAVVQALIGGRRNRRRIKF